MGQVEHIRDAVQAVECSQDLWVSDPPERPQGSGAGGSLIHSAGRQSRFELPAGASSAYRSGMRTHLTKTVVDALTCPAGRKDFLVFDQSTRGFGIRVTAAGGKIFVLQYKRDGKVRRAILGRYGEVTLAQARRSAEALRGAVQSGGDPVESRKTVTEARRFAATTQAARDVFTVETLLERWQAIGLADRSAAHRKEAPRAIRSALGPLVTRPTASITAEIVQAVLDGILIDAPMQALHVRNYARAAWNWARRRNLVTDNPFALVSIDRRPRSRDRVLSDAELRDAWHGAGAMTWPFGPFIRLMILTLQRRGEVAGIRWSELSADLSAWTIPAERAKNGRTHVVHLAKPARAILKTLPRQQDAHGERIDLVFTTTGTTPVSGFKSAAGGLRRAIQDARDALAEPDGAPKKASAPATDWVLHDFRRTGVSKMAELGIPPHVADRILNHVTGAIRGTMAVYQRFEFMPERKRALEVWADHVLAIAEGKAVPSNVTPLRSG